LNFIQKSRIETGISIDLGVYLRTRYQLISVKPFPYMHAGIVLIIVHIICIDVLVMFKVD